MPSIYKKKGYVDTKYTMSAGEQKPPVLNKHGFDVTRMIEFGWSQDYIDNVKAKIPIKTNCRRKSCSNGDSPCQHGPCSPSREPSPFPTDEPLEALEDLDLDEIGRKLRNMYVKKQRTSLNYNTRESVENSRVFVPGTVAKWAIKYDGINVQIIRVGSYLFFLTAGGMVLHQVLPAYLFGEWHEGESVRAELTLSHENDNNYECFQATLTAFLRSRAYTDVEDFSKTKMARKHLSLMNKSPQWTAAGQNRMIRIHVFGLGLRDNTIPDNSIARMLGSPPVNVQAVEWKPVTSAQELLYIRDREWQQGKEGIIVRTVSTPPIEDFGSRPTSLDAAVQAGADHPQQRVQWAKSKKPIPLVGRVINMDRNGKGRSIYKVLLTKGPHNDADKVEVGLGYTHSWEEGNMVHLYAIPRTFGCDKVRWFVGLQHAMQEDSPARAGRECPAQRPRSDSEGPAPDTGAARGPRTCEPAMPTSKRVKVLDNKGVCPKCNITVWGNCPRVNMSGVYFHVRCTNQKPLKTVTNCGCGQCARK